MKRPYVICLMTSAVNGKCSGKFYQLPEVDAARKANAAARSYYDCGAILYGTRTMVESYGETGPLSDEDMRIPREDFLPAGETDQFIVSIDPAGTVRLPARYLVRNGRPPAQVIQVLTEQVSDAYLAYLRNLQVAYIFGGRERLDLAQVLQKLYQHFHIEKLIIAGGGVVNYSFLSAGLIDEISLVIAPACAGDSGAVATFEPSPFAGSDVPVPLRLLTCEATEGGAVWLRYKAGNAAPL